MKRLFTTLAVTFLIVPQLVLLSAALARARAVNVTARRTTRHSAAVAGGETLESPTDRGWPRGYKMPSGAQVVLYQPQVASWDDRKRMVAYIGASSPVTQISPSPWQPWASPVENSAPGSWTGR